MTSTKKSSLIVSIAVVSVFYSYVFNSEAQNIGINTTGAAPNASAVLDVDAAPGNNKGLLIPRVPLSATNSNAPIGASIATSLLVYNTATAGISPNNVVPGYYYWNGTKWISISGGSGGNDWGLLGNAGTTAGTNFIGTTDAQDLVFKTNNTEWMRILSGGNVGIQTTNPEEKLVVMGTQRIAGTTLLDDANQQLFMEFSPAPLANNATILGPDARFRILYDRNINTLARDYLVFETLDGNEVDADGGFVFRGRNNVGVKRDIMIVNGRGEVGIGTVNPATKLHVQSGEIRNDNNGFAVHSAYTYDGTSPDVTPHFLGYRARGTQSAPSQLLAGDALCTFQGRNFFAPTNSSAAITFRTSQNHSSVALGTEMDFILTANNTTSSYVAMKLLNSGNLGIGTMLPTARLSVNGIADKPGGGTWAVFSDKNLKKNISSYTEGLSLITKVNTVNFEYNEKLEEIWGKSDQINGKIFQGVIAQELQQIAPDMVKEVEIEIKDEKGNTIKTVKVLEVDPNKFTYALINAVKQQQKEIEELQQQNASISATNNINVELLKSYEKRLLELEAIVKQTAAKN